VSRRAKADPVQNGKKWEFPAGGREKGKYAEPFEAITSKKKGWEKKDLMPEKKRESEIGRS